MNPTAHPAERRLELLADRATVGLTPEEQAELDRLAVMLGAPDEASFDLAAAATDLASETSSLEPMPPSLEAAVLARAIAVLARPPVDAPLRIVRGGTVPIPPKLPEAPPAPAAAVVAIRPDPRRWFGWMAAAACLVVAALGWLAAVRARRDLAAVDRGAGSVPTASASASSAVLERERLLADARAVRASFAPATDPAGRDVSGNVVWSSAEQRGYMRFHGLAPNDPNKSQYQLWIFDPDHDERYPVDGGVFDVASGDVVVPIEAKLRIGAPTLFAVTIEKPGGVVVSTRERLVVAAKIGAT